MSDSLGNMKLNTQDDVLSFFEAGGCMVDVENNVAYISDIGGDVPTFYGIMVAEGIPNEVKWDVDEACQYALSCIPAPGSGATNRMGFMEVPGFWFGELVGEVIANPKKFIME